MLREIISNEWITILIVLSIGILAFTKAAFSNRFNDFLWVIGSSKYLKIYSRKQKFIDWFEGLLFLNFIMSLSLFFIILDNTFFESIAFSISFFVKLLIGIGAIILIKMLLERLIGSIFEIDSLIDSYIFQKTNYKNYIGLVLLPINILLIFTVQPTKTILYFAIGLLLIINLVGIITSFKMHQKLILNNLFYFILYLCALEIAPYIILYKILN
ncbi:DUF4271 domain-containing protein [Flavobacteriaceae bacterium AH-315-B10]|nr:DUF4271 domain-containing protein [Flavobacteriaceae bacterium AH-315-B10]